MANIRYVLHFFEQTKDPSLAVATLHNSGDPVLNHLCSQKRQYFYLRIENICLSVPVLSRTSKPFLQQVKHNLTTNHTSSMQRDSGTILTSGSTFEGDRSKWIVCHL